MGEGIDCRCLQTEEVRAIDMMVAEEESFRSCSDYGRTDITELPKSWRDQVVR